MSPSDIYAVACTVTFALGGIVGGSIGYVLGGKNVLSIVKEKEYAITLAKKNLQAQEQELDSVKQTIQSFQNVAEAVDKPVV